MVYSMDLVLNGCVEKVGAGSGTSTTCSLSGLEVFCCHCTGAGPFAVPCCPAGSLGHK